MRKITLFVAAVALFVLIGIDTWLCIRTLAPASALAGSTDKAPVIMITGAKGLPTSRYYDYEIVVD
jgi:hypothetical protein